MAIQNEDGEMHQVGHAIGVDAGDEAQPLEWLPELRPLRLHLPRRQDP